MTDSLSSHKTSYLKCIDGKAKYVASKLIVNKPVTSLLLKYISEMYTAAKSEQDFSDKNFFSAYHSPITSDLEFLIARVLYHYSKKKELGWTISLRKQKTDTNTNSTVAPDIKIEFKNKVVAIVEIKAKAGWMQPFFSDDRMKSDIDKGRDPSKQIAKDKDQLMKYASFKSCGKNRVFLFLPSFINVHRKKYKKTPDDYRKTFARNSTLRKSNLILLSENPSLDLASITKDVVWKPTDNFETFINGISQ